MRKYRDEKGKVVGRVLYESPFIEVIYDVPGQETYLAQKIGDDELGRKQVKALRRDLKTALAVWR